MKKAIILLSIITACGAEINSSKRDKEIKVMDTIKPSKPVEELKSFDIYEGSNNGCNIRLNIHYHKPFKVEYELTFVNVKNEKITRETGVVFKGFGDPAPKEIDGDILPMFEYWHFPDDAEIEIDIMPERGKIVLLRSHLNESNKLIRLNLVHLDKNQANYPKLDSYESGFDSNGNPKE